MQPIDPPVAFRGGRIAGTLYVVAGAGSINSQQSFDEDVYVIRREFADSRRLTYSVGEGFDYVVAMGPDVLVSDVRDVFVGEEVRQLRISRRSAVLGPILGYGLVQAAGPGGRFLYTPFYNAGNGVAGYWKVFEARIGRRGRRLLLRTRTKRDIPEPWAGWGPGGQIAILDGTRVVFDAGSSGAYSVRGVNGYSLLTGGGPNGLLALHGPRKIGLLSWGGQRLRVFKTTWYPMCFSPNGRDLVVVNSRWDRLALMSLKTGALSPFASVAGDINQIAWVAS